MTSKIPTSEDPNRATASAPRAGDNEEQRVPAPGGPFEPRDGNDKPSIKSVWDVFKILIAVTAWYTTSDAASALREAARYTELGKAISLLHLSGVPNVVLWGALLGVVHGFILAVKAVVFIWAGPAFFEFLYPAFVAASRISARVATDLRKAWSQGPISLDTTNSGYQPTRGGDNGTKNQDKTSPDTGAEKPTEEPAKPTEEPAKPTEEPAKPTDDSTQPSDTPASEEPVEPSDGSDKPEENSSKKEDEAKRD